MNNYPGSAPISISCWTDWAHRLTGKRRGTWSLFVTANWRLTFRIDSERKEVMDLNIEDYH